MPFKSDKQRRYMHANLPRIAKRWERDYANGGIASQGGMKNYLGEQPMVNAPKNWRSGPDSPPTELAYITQPEKDLILRSNIHGSLQNGPNEGPSGIMSLDAQGDYTRDRSQDAARGQMSRGDSERAVRQEAHMRNILTGQKNIGQTSAVSDRTRRGAVPEYSTFIDSEGKKKTTYIGSSYKSPGQTGGWLSRLFGGQNKYGYAPIYNKRPGSGWFGTSFGGDPDIQFNKGAGRYEHYDPRTGTRKPGYGGRILGGLASLVTGIPLIGGAIGSAIDKYKPKSYWEKKGPEEQARLNALSLTAPEDQKVYLPQGSDMPMARNIPGFNWTDPINTPLTRKLSTRENDYYTGTMSFEDQVAKNKSILESMGFEEATGEITPTETARDFPLKGTFDKDAWKYNQPEEWQTQEFPVREDFLPKEKMTSSIIQTGKPMINDEWRWNRW